jgi:hypothetical protein
MTPRWVITTRLVVASLICLLILAITIPNLGTITLPNYKIGYGWRDVMSIGIIVVPLLLIFVGAACSRMTEYVGWALLLILFILRFVG